MYLRTFRTKHLHDRARNLERLRGVEIRAHTAYTAAHPQIYQKKSSSYLSA